MNPKVILIHPKDSTTSFLGSIISFLKENDFQMQIFEPDHTSTMVSLEAEVGKSYEDGDLLLFLGHGSSRMLYGGVDDKQEKTILFNSDQVASFFSHRKKILMACRSSELLVATNPVGEYIGFGNMPTAIDEVLGMRDQADPYYLRGLDESTLFRFREILTSMMMEAFKYWRISMYSLRSFYLILRYSLNKTLTQVATLSDLSLRQRQLLFQIIQETKDEIIHR